MALRRNRSKMCTDREELEEILKVGVAEVGSCYLTADSNVILKHYEPFFLLAAERTERLNPAALGKAAKAQFAMTQQEAKTFGQHLAGAFSTVKKVGNSMKTGAKVDPTIIKLYKVMMKEPEETSSASTKKEETGPPSLKEEATEPPGKKVKAEPTDGLLLSPGKVLSMYGCPGVKKEVGLHLPEDVKREKVEMQSPSEVLALYGQPFVKKEKVQGPPALLKYYSPCGGARGVAPAHPRGIWVGAWGGYTWGGVGVLVVGA